MKIFIIFIFMKKNTLKLTLWSIIAIFMLWGCKGIDDFSNASLEFDGDYATALFNANIGIDDVVGELDSATTVELDADGLLHLIYRGNFTQRNSNDVFANIPLIPVVISDTVTPFPYNGGTDMQLTLVILKTPTIGFTCQSPFTEDINLEISFPDVIDPLTGEVFVYSTVIPYDGAAPSPGAGIIDMSGLHIIPVNGSGDGTIVYNATLPDGTRVELDDFLMLYQNFQASYLEGYLGNEPYDLPRDTIEIDFFENWIAGGVVFEEPKIEIEIENSFGFPVRSIFNTMEVWNKDGSTISLESNVLTDGIDFNYPTLTEVGESKFTYFTMDNSNSNIQDLFGNRPIALDYDLDALANPDADQSIVGFATDSSFFTVFVFVDMPVIANTDMFTIRTDVETEELGEDYEFADYVTLKIVSDNNIPVDLALQMYFEDANGVVLDSLFDLPLNQLLPDQAIIKAAGVDADGNSNSTTHHEIEIDLPREKFEAFSNMANLGLITIMDNAPGQFVRFNEQDDLNLKVGVRAGISK